MTPVLTPTTPSITFYPDVNLLAADWAWLFGLTPDTINDAASRILRARRHEAIAHPEATPIRRAVQQLDAGGWTIYFSEEEGGELLIRGYGLNEPHAGIDEESMGGHFV